MRNIEGVRGLPLNDCSQVGTLYRQRIVQKFFFNLKNRDFIQQIIVYRKGTEENAQKCKIHGAIQLDYRSRTRTAALREKHKLKVNQLVHVTVDSILEEVFF